MAAEGIHKDDIGTQFVVTILKGGVAYDLKAVDDGAGSVTTKQIKLRKPNGTVTAYDAAYYTDGSDGKIVYPTVADDLDVAGRWDIQAFIVITGGDDEGSWHSDMVEFLVLDNVD